MELGEKERQCRVALEMIIKKRATREQKKKKKKKEKEKKKDPCPEGERGSICLTFYVCILSTFAKYGTLPVPMANRSNSRGTAAAKGGITVNYSSQAGQAQDIGLSSPPGEIRKKRIKKKSR